VTLREYAVVGHRVILHPGVVLGADGFGFEPVKSKYQKIQQVGTVEIGDDVEIGANTTIDRAKFGKTRIGRGTKIDNLVQIGHNCVIGEDCIICAQVGMAGSTILGNRITLAGQVGIAGHITIGDDCIVMGQAGVAKDTEPRSILFGSPGLPHKTFKRSYVVFEHLPELQTKLRELEKLVTELQAKQE
jgi:UDP-3-O-[3-hydroxymyristoyl] glucosamine N-acyltransferase